jgi:crotonobetainyl-CoA:carnitine CoA-transferase CaiB-like acyl-CoA transferase
VLEHFCDVPQEDAWRAGQENGLPGVACAQWTTSSTMSICTTACFFTEVEHPELGRGFIYPGGATIYNGSPWRISRRAPLIGEHNEEIFCGELGMQKAELTLLAESGVI